MEIKQYSRMGTGNTVIFTKPDLIIINPVQIFTIEKFTYNGQNEFSYSKKGDKEIKGEMFRVTFGTRLEMYIDKEDKKKLEKAL